MKITTAALSAIATLTLSACVTGPSVSPVEVTRFHSANMQLDAGTIFIESAPGDEIDSLELAPYKAAIAAELAALGYRETSRAEATQIAQVKVDRYVSQPAQKRNPISVGAGGSAGSYGSGVGMGIGINLGGGKREMLGTDMAVMIRDKATSNVMWEGRATISVSDNSQFAEDIANAGAIADALFTEFPGNNGETVEVRVTK